jgi:glycerate dehydrogenase
MEPVKQQRIVVLDGHTLTRARPGEDVPAGEPAWNALESLGELTVYDRTGSGEVVERASGASIVLTNKTPLPGEVIAALPGLRYIGVLATGVNVVDLEAAGKAGVVVTNIPGYSGSAVAQHVFALLLELTNRVAGHDRAVHDGAWVGCADFCFTLGPITELAGKTLGIVGAGDIGRRVAKIGDALGMDVLVSSRTERGLGVPARWCDVDELFEQADVVTLHCPLTEQTQHMVDARRLSLMKRTSYLVNTARGALIDEPALALTLNEGRIAGAGLDVLGIEPPCDDNPLLAAPGCIITPHNAWAAEEARHRLMGIAVENVRGFLAGEAVNVVG